MAPPRRGADDLGSAALDLKVLLPDVWTAILERLDLALRPGMTLEETRAVLGEPVDRQVLAADRTTFDFASEGYRIGCTIHHEEGLLHLTVALDWVAPD